MNRNSAKLNKLDESDHGKREKKVSERKEAIHMLVLVNTSEIDIGDAYSYYNHGERRNEIFEHRKRVENYFCFGYIAVYRKYEEDKSQSRRDGYRMEQSLDYRAAGFCFDADLLCKLDLRIVIIVDAVAVRVSSVSAYLNSE